MKTNELTLITVKASIEAPVEKVWNFWTKPEHIIHWNFASDDWHCPWAKNDLDVKPTTGADTGDRCHIKPSR